MFQPLPFVLVAAAAVPGCALLLALSQFGQDPQSQLPPAMIVMFGALLSGGLSFLGSRLSPREFVAALLVAVAVNLVYLVTPDRFARPEYLLAPATALLLTALFRLAERPYGEMLSAMTVYVMATVLANYTFDSFIPIGDFFLVNVGTFFFGITFTQRDRVHRFGRRRVYQMIVVAALANVAVALSLDTPLRYVLVAFLAILLSETVDTEIYSRLLDRPWFYRVASSNAVSAPLDTVIFTVLAFAGASFATVGWMFQVIVTDVLVKYAAGLLAALPLARLRPPASATAVPAPTRSSSRQRP